jgi:hypothetical protein
MLNKLTMALIFCAGCAFVGAGQAYGFQTSFIQGGFALILMISVVEKITTLYSDTIKYIALAEFTTTQNRQMPEVDTENLRDVIIAFILAFVLYLL